MKGKKKSCFSRRGAAPNLRQKDILPQVKSASDGFVLGARISETLLNNSSSRYDSSASVSKISTCANFSKKAAPKLRQKVEPLSKTPKSPKEKKMSNNSLTRDRDILGYIPARLTPNKRWYVEWYSFNPDAGCLQRKRISVPHIKPLALRRRYAADMVANVNAQLASGWNPFLQLASAREYTLFDNVCETYYRYLLKMVESGAMRPKTYNGYASYLNTFRKWNSSRSAPVTYIYQLKSDVADQFLDYIWLDRQKSARTRDNYLGWLRSFCEWMLEKHYITESPVAGFTNVLTKKYAKNRTVIPKEDMIRLKEYLMEHNQYFLLACELLYHCFIRPREMSYIRIRDVSVYRSTVSISGETSKNGKDAVVTLPDCVTKLMLEMDVLTKPGDWYLFSDGFVPGTKYRLPKYFCDEWNKVRTALKFPDEYKFYSLKDTGITDMIKDNTDLIAVRDQARHSSLLMTDLYTPLSSKKANDDIKNKKSYF